jgi:hypothetical protein
VRIRGISYDTGFMNGEQSTRASFELATVRREMQIIASDLHCNAVRVYGADPDRMVVASEYGLEAGMQVWFSPYTVNLTTAEYLRYLADCAARAQPLSSDPGQLVLVVGCELSTFLTGFLPGDDLDQRLANVTAMPPSREVMQAFGTVSPRLNAFLAEAIDTVRSSFRGQITYSSGTWENVGWRPFDIVSVDLYRDRTNAATYREQLRQYFGPGKPVVITEFGCATYRGAADRGALGFMIVDDTGKPRKLNAEYERSEAEQAQYLADLLTIFEQENVDGAFWFSFAGYELPHRADPRLDLDMASYGLVKIIENGRSAAYPDLNWEPKAAFDTLARAYGTKGR